MIQNKSMYRLAAILIAGTACLPAQTERPLQSLRKAHPRLIALDNDLERIRSLIQNNADARAEIRSPAAAVFETASAAPPPPQNQNEGARKLVVRLPEKISSTRIVVVLRPRMNANERK
jgi:hypothetical protein